LHLNILFYIPYFSLDKCPPKNILLRRQRPILLVLYIEIFLHCTPGIERVQKLL